MITVTSIVNQMMLQQQIDNTMKTITNGGLEDTTENKLYKFRNDRIQAQKDMELNSIHNAQKKYQEFDTTFESMKGLLEDFREKLLERTNPALDATTKSTIDFHLSEMTKMFEGLMNSKSATGEKLFNGYSEFQIGNSMRIARTLSPEMMQFDDETLVEKLQQFVGNESSDLDELDRVLNLVEQRRVEFGVRGDTIDSMERFYEHTKLTNGEFMSKRYKLEEAIAEFNNLSLTYEALSKMNARVASLSLINYI